MSERERQREFNDAFFCDYVIGGLKYAEQMMEQRSKDQEYAACLVAVGWVDEKAA